MADKELSRAEQEELGLKKREAQIDGLKVDDKEKDVLKRYNKGEQNFSIAKEVYGFVNSDTVGTVIGIIRKHHADDYAQTEQLNDYRGYTGAN